MTLTIKLVPLFLLISVSTLGQIYSGKQNTEWTADLNFGNTLFEQNKAVAIGLNEKNNVGFDIGLTCHFHQGIFISSSVTFSFLDEFQGIWENPLNYLSVDLNGGYTFNKKNQIQPFLGIGFGYIQEPNIISNADEGAISFNTMAGLTYWIPYTNIGIAGQYTFKSVNNDFMVSHHRYVLGVKYKW